MTKKTMTDLIHRQMSPKDLFKNVKVIGRFCYESDSKMVTTCIRFSNGEYAVYDADFGHDPCVDYTNEELGKIVDIRLIFPNGDYRFESLDEVKSFLEGDSKFNYTAEGLLKDILNREKNERK